MVKVLFFLVFLSFTAMGQDWILAPKPNARTTGLAETDTTLTVRNSSSGQSAIQDILSPLRLGLYNATEQHYSDSSIWQTSANSLIYMTGLENKFTEMTINARGDSALGTGGQLTFTRNGIGRAGMGMDEKNFILGRYIVGKIGGPTLGFQDCMGITDYPWCNQWFGYSHPGGTDSTDSKFHFGGLAVDASKTIFRITSNAATTQTGRLLEVANAGIPKFWVSAYSNAGAFSNVFTTGTFYHHRNTSDTIPVMDSLSTNFMHMSQDDDSVRGDKSLLGVVQLGGGTGATSFPLRIYNRYTVGAGISLYDTPGSTELAMTAYNGGAYVGTTTGHSLFLRTNGANVIEIDQYKNVNFDTTTYGGYIKGNQKMRGHVIIGAGDSVVVEITGLVPTDFVVCGYHGIDIVSHGSETVLSTEIHVANKLTIYGVNTRHVNYIVMR
jgi:hypothetical protein